MATMHFRKQRSETAPEQRASAARATTSGPARPSFAQALSIVRSVVEPAKIECVALGDTLGRVTATTVTATRDHPAFDVSAMDGFAIAWSETLEATATAPVVLRCVAPILPGTSSEPAIAGTCAPISTGAMVPRGYDAVVTKERARLLSGPADMGLVIDGPVRPLLNVRQKGEDARAGQIVMAAGRKVGAAAIGALAAYGIRTLDVYRKPGIGVVQTGDELAPDGAMAGAGTIPDANGPMIDAMIREAGLDVYRRTQCRDDPGKLAAGLARLIDDPACDIIISTGGISAGDQDWIPRVLGRLGARIVFHGVRMRPGKPVLFAVLPNGTLFFGLPGNPVAAALGFRFLVCGAIRAMWGLPPEQGGALAVRAPSTPGVTQFLKARRIDAEVSAVEILSGQQSHRMRTLIDADCWLAIDADTQIASVYPLVAHW